jgi:DNA-directed RNA polymerase subunit M/transcription elongation factor TFIIS
MKIVKCPSCGSVVVCPSNMGGTATLCPSCRAEIQVPTAPEATEEDLRRLREKEEKRPRDETQSDGGEAHGRDTDAPEK